MVTAILSSFNEIDNALFWANVQLLKDQPGVELIIVDGGSDDGTQEKLKDLKSVVLPNSQRATRFNHGIEMAAGHLILLVHPRSLLSEPGLRELLQEDRLKNWGAFRHRFDWPHPILKFTSWYSNYVRGKRRGIYYLDHCLYFSSDLKPHARFPEIAIFEDTAFCCSLRMVTKPKLLKSEIITSAIRFRKNGIFKQSIMNQALKLLFHLGVSADFMNRIYERGLSLNISLKK